MSPKKLFSAALILILLAVFTGCSTTGRYKDPEKLRYQRASEECIRYGLRRGSHDYKNCMEKRLEATKKDIVR